MSGLNRKTVGLKLRTLHIKFIRVNSTMDMGKLFTAMFVKIVDISFYLHLFGFLVLIYMFFAIVSRLRFGDQV